MKKLFILSLIFGTFAVLVPAASAAVAETDTAVEQMRRMGPPQRHYNRRPRSVIRTRTVRRGIRWYRETYRITYLPNGRTHIQVIRRVRIR